MHKSDPNVYYNGAQMEEAGAMTDGTTIIACKYNGGIMLAADGRSSNVSVPFRPYLSLEHVRGQLVLG